jgi:hypothetical protein
MPPRPILRLSLAAAFAALLTLAGCGGGGSGSSQASLRLVNATTDVAALNLALNTSTRFSGVAIDAQTDGSSVDSGTYSAVLTSGSSTTALLTSDRSFSGNTDYTAVAWGTAASLKLATLSDSASASDAPTSGNAAVRVFNTASDAGALDVYLTATATELDSVSANVSSLAVGSLSSYVQLAQGSYRLRVTGAGDKTDLRLDLPVVTLGNQSRVTVLVQPGSGGVLVNALQLVYQASGTTPLKNTQARARLAASVSGNGTVSASIGGTSLNVNLRSPSLGNYVLVPAGSAQALAVSVNGSLLGDSRAVVAGSDYTLLVSGDPASPTLGLITDDNRLPSSLTRAKLRLVNGAFGQTGLTLSADFSALASNVGYGTASAYASVPSSTSTTLEVSSPLSTTPLYSTSSSPVPIAAQGVYSVFLLGGGSAPVGVLRKDR